MTKRWRPMLKQWDRERDEHYVEPEWCSQRLFAVEKFIGHVHDPACGFGNIVKAARAHSIRATASDIVKRGFYPTRVENFLETKRRFDNIVCNPPFLHLKEFALHAIRHTDRKVAMIWQTRRLNAAGPWLLETPLACIWFMSPRPSMPPGIVVATGKDDKGKVTKVGGGFQEYCWLVFKHGYKGKPEIDWLFRDPQ